MQKHFTATFLEVVEYRCNTFRGRYSFTAIFLEVVIYFAVTFLEVVRYILGNFLRALLEIHLQKKLTFVPYLSY